MATERDGWILVSAQAPDRIEEWIGQKRADLDDPDYVAMYRDFGSLAQWRRMIPASWISPTGSAPTPSGW